MNFCSLSWAAIRMRCMRLDQSRWEEILAAAYDKAGFDEVILTPRSGDLGRDVIAIRKGFGSVKLIEQAKAYNHRRRGHAVSALDNSCHTSL